MQKRVLWAVLTVCALLMLSGCEIDNCEVGSDGCLAGKPINGKCRFDLVIGAGGVCTKPTQSSACPSDCEAPALCVPERGECVNFCEAPTTLPNTGPFLTQILCGGETGSTLTFAQICTNTCELTCRYWNWFCPDARFNCTTECKKAEVQTDCVKKANEMPAGCGDGTPDQQRACQQKKCEDVRNKSCTEKPGLCPIDPSKPGDTGTPVCRSVVCNNDCAGNVFDGYCDDGAFSNGATDFCTWGTDCADCGPRRGDPGPLDTGKFEIGEVCPNSFRCEGNTLAEGSSVVPNESWCRQVGGEGNTRCVQDCSSDGEACPAGFVCRKIDPPYKDDKDREGKGCFPMNSCQ